VKLQQTGLYLQDQINLNDKWFLQLGGRRDFADATAFDRLSSTRSTQDDAATTGRAGLVYLSDMGLAPYVSYSEAFVPTLETDIFGNPFDPQTGQQYEAGVKYQPPGMANAFVTFSAFDITKQNVLTIDPDNPLNQIQTGEISSRGLEFEAVASLDWGLDLRGAYTYLDVEIAASNDGTAGNTYGVPTQRHRCGRTTRCSVGAWPSSALVAAFAISATPGATMRTLSRFLPSRCSMPPFTMTGGSSGSRSMPRTCSTRNM
jgi:iron complex outermembrane receptor protein